MVAHPIVDQSGQVVEFVGSSMDVTEQYQNRVALEKAFQEIQLLKDQLYKENLALRDEVDRASMFEEIVGASKPLKTLLSRIAKVASTDSTVFITGETGTGKELIARAVHKRSQRSGRVFVSVNCAAFAPTLISSEFFGHEKGAFTGATQRRLGRFELADGGTIFLDEVGELLPDTQVALLRVLQEREFERVGGGQTIHVDVRVIAATNRDLKAAIESGASSPGSVLSAECVSHSAAASARAEGRHPDAGRIFRTKIRQPSGQEHPYDRQEDSEPVAVL